MTHQPIPDQPGSTPDEERDRAIESLLVAGLDRYFAGDHEQAIHAWTRVLFLDRSHPRARAYIERARSALAERQRETDELLHRGLAALDDGRIDDARTLLVSAVRRGGPVEAAEVALQRLVRLDVASGGEAAATPESGAAVAAPAIPPRGRLASRLAVIATAGVLLAIAVALAFGWRGLEWWAGESAATTGSPAAVPAAQAPLPVPSPSDFALRRGRELFERGHLHEALAALDEIRYDDPLQPEANRLRAEIQRVLLQAAGAPSSTAPAPVEPDRP